MRPNLLLILTDQQRADTIAARSANAFLQTPHLDRLAAEGVWFDAMYSEMPECVPARSMILTGRYGHQTGVMGNRQRLGSDVETFVHRLKQQGYYTQAIGKMHFNPVREPHGFDRLLLAEELPGTRDEDDYLGFLNSVGYGYVREPHGIRHEYYYIPQVSQVPDAYHSTTWIGDRTVEFIQHPPARPWFLYTSFIKPHPPFEPTIPFLSRYDPDELPLPVGWEGTVGPRFELLEAQDYMKWTDRVDDNLVRLIKAAYYACITQIDVQIGRILDALERTRQRSQTVVVFSSDHGELLGDHRHFGKRAFYAGSCRVPLILSWPGMLPENAVRKEIVGHQDFHDFFLDAAGVASSALRGWAEGTRREGRQYLFGELFEGESALYMAASWDWKYQYSPNGGTEHLMNLAEDPSELRDFSRERQDVRNAMRRALVDFFREDGYVEALNDAQDDLKVIPRTPIKWPRNRQFARWS
ncbi:MAG: sulfatase-like hydrolase/transferase [Firmicutes bacterium]|nr:sulfatase-like hydrolase/transferase [Bacillota bacterium]